MKLIHDRQITISVGSSRKSVNWQPQKLMIGDLWERLKTPRTGSETLAQYMQMGKAQQDDLKDVGGFVGGSLKGPRRKNEDVTGRDLITLDFDSIPPGTTDAILLAVRMLCIGVAVYSTRKHKPDAPRLRVVFPLSRTVSADEYEPIARKVAEWIRIDWADPTTFESSRLMYWPSCCIDSEFVFQSWDAPLLDPDRVLQSYTDWHDVTSWPQVPGAKSFQKLAKKQGDPDTRLGVVGAFNRVCGDVHTAISTYLSDKYTVCANDPNRYTFTGGSTTGGAVVYDNGKFLFSHHATDPCGGRLVNCFDLVRLHKFGDKDDEALPGTPTGRLPSYMAMCEFAESIPDVVEDLERERVENAKADFEALAVQEPDETALQEFIKYHGKPLSCDAVQAAMNAYGYRIRRNLITGETQVFGIPAKYSSENALNTLPVILKDALRANGVKNVSSQAVIEYLGVIADESRYNPVKEMVINTPWDGQDRITECCSLLGQITPFEQTLVRKWLIQCMAMALNSYDKPIGLEGVLTLQGPEGIGKTEFFRRLSMKADWFSEGLSLDMQNKDSVLRSINCWICELGELDSTSRRMQSALKSHLTAKTDKIREPYAKAQRARPRRTSYCATVNPEEFLTGSTGNRRFWVIPVTNMDLQRILSLKEEEVQQLWAQVYQMWLADPEGYHLTQEERTTVMDMNAKYQSFLPGEEELLERLDFDMPADEWQYFRASRIADLLSFGSRQTITCQQIGRALNKIIKIYPQVVKRPGRANMNEYLLPLRMEMQT